MTASVTVEQLAAEAWAFRARVEYDAVVRFGRLAALLAGIDNRAPLLSEFLNAADDERRHLDLCLAVAGELGAEPPSSWPVVTSIAPAQLGRREGLAYEVVAACCIAETESMATITTLLNCAPKGSRFESALRIIARDEVRHARLGWAYVTSERSAMDVSFLAGYLPAMLSGSIDEGLFRPATEAAMEDPALLSYGVLPHTQKRDVFVNALDTIVLPGFRLVGINDSAARQWLAERQLVVMPPGGSQVHAWPARR